MNVFKRKLLSGLRRIDVKAYRWSFSTFASLLPTVLDVELPSIPFGDRNAYHVYAKALNAQSVVYSCGIGRDASFGLALIDAFGLSVFAFDPTHQSARAVRGLDLPEQYQFHQMAVAKTDGSIRLQHIVPSNDDYVPGTVLNVGSRSFGEEAVPSKRLPTLAEEYGHDVIDVLKLDVEGAEFELLDDMLATSVRPGQLVLEFHPSLLNMERHRTLLGAYGWHYTAEVMERLRRAGYHLFWTSESLVEQSYVHERLLHDSGL